MSKSAGKSSRKPSIFKSRSFYFTIVSAFVSLLLITVLPIMYFVYRQDKIIISELTHELLEQNSRTIIEKTGNYFLPALISVELSSRLSELGAISCNDFTQIEMYTLGVLKSYPQVSMFFLADEQGNYIRAWRLPDGNTESRIIRAADSPPTDSYVYRDSLFQVSGVRKIEEIDYDPRIRPWYVGAREAEGSFLTDVYILFRNKKPAITSSHPVYGKTGELIGVWAMDIELDDISNFLKTQKVGKSGIELIINEKGEVVAYPDYSKIIKEENGALRPVKVEEIGFGPLTVAYRQHKITKKSGLLVEFEGNKYIASFIDIPKPFPVQWKIGIVAPLDDFIGKAKLSVILMGGISAFTLGIALLVAILISRGLTRPVRLMAEATGKIKNFNLEEVIHIPSRTTEIQVMHEAICSMQKGLHAFRRYVPAELVRQLISTGKGAELGGQKKELTILFSDIKGFTSIAERTTPEELMLHLSDYFDELTRIVSHHRGTIDKYIGDAMLAFWGAPIHDDEHAINACHAGLACQEKIRELNNKWIKEGRSPFITRIGISTGESVVGNVGSIERINYTVIGDNVNIASRLEASNKIYGTEILVTRKTFDAASGKFWFRPIGLVAAKGKKKHVEIYELVGRRSGKKAKEDEELCTEFTRGFHAYLSKSWAEASEIFTNISIKFPQDHPTGLYLDRCSKFLVNPPGEEWLGIEYQQFK